MGSSGRRWAWVRLAVVAAAVAFAGAKSQSLWPRLASAPAPAAAAAPGSPGGGTALVPIEQVRLGDRVPGENPAEEPDGRFGAAVDVGTWRRVDLSCRKQDGTAVAVSLLRPAWWLEAEGAEVGGTLTIAVPECGIDGEAEVLAVGPCPLVRPGRGSVVTGTFRHENAAVIDLRVAGLDQTIGTTPNHKFWSGDRGAFMRADALGCPHEARAGGHAVYNIETYPQHVYRVSAAGLLVHNADPAKGYIYEIVYLQNGVTKVYVGSNTGDVYERLWGTKTSQDRHAVGREILKANPDATIRIWEVDLTGIKGKGFLNNRSNTPKKRQSKSTVKILLRMP